MKIIKTFEAFINPTINEQVSPAQLKKIKKQIENDKTFNKIYQQTGEDYGYALEVWLEDFGDKVGVGSQEEAEELISQLSESNK